jgi:DNA topoisomerase-1
MSRRPALREARHLHRADDEEPGIRRLRKGRGFTYRDARGRPIDAGTLDRIKRLAVPPAWTDVWICPSPDGHLQATGRDAAGRKQYRYHPDWRAARELAKFGALGTFGPALGRIRRRRDRDLADVSVAREPVTAGVVLLLERTMIRVGNEEYVRTNGHYGLTTLRSQHVRVRRGGVLDFRFVGKSGVVHRTEVTDPRLAQLVTKCRRLPGEHLFQYVNGDGLVHPVTSQLVNQYLRDAADGDVTAKTFRTWMATVLAAHALAGLDPPRNASQMTRQVNTVIDAVAERLKNTRAVARASYIHPAVLQTYADGTFAERWEAAEPSRIRLLTAPEQRLVGFLRGLETGRTRFALAA